MKVLATQVKNGKIETPPGVLAEGQAVTVVFHDDDEPVALSEQQKAFLQESLEQIDRGEWIDGWQLLDEIEAEHG